MAAIELPVEDGEDEKVGGGFVKLYGVERFVQRHGCGGVGAETHAPGQVALPAPATARGETAEPSDGLTQRHARSESIHGRKYRQVLTAHIQYRDEERGDEAAMEHPGGLQRLEREDLAGVPDVVAQVEQKHEELRSHDAGHGTIDRQVGDLIGRQTYAARQTQGDPEAGQKPERHQYAVSGDVEGAD